MNEKNTKSKRGFAAMKKEDVIKIARKGGLAVSSNKEYMQTIGRLGGQITQRKKRNARNT